MERAHQPEGGGHCGGMEGEEKSEELLRCDSRWTVFGEAIRGSAPGTGS